jgi:hypothetical protein
LDDGEKWENENEKAEFGIQVQGEEGCAGQHGAVG